MIDLILQNYGVCKAWKSFEIAEFTKVTTNVHVAILTFLHHIHAVSWRIPSSPSSYVHAMVEELRKRMLWHALSELPHQQIFDEATNSISWCEEQSVWQQLLGGAEQWVATVSYSTGIMGAVRLWAAANSKDQNMCRNRPFSFTSSIIPFSVYSRKLSVNYSHAGVHRAQRTWGVVQGSFNQR